MSNAVNRESKECYTLVEFSYGNPVKNVRMTTSNGQVTSGGFLYSSNPAMDVKVSDNSGSVESQSSSESYVEVFLDDDPLFSNASQSLPHSEIRVSIKQLLIAPDTDPYEITLFQGKVQSSVRNRAGRAKKVTFYLESDKNELDVPAGMVCNSECIWVFGGNGCNRARIFDTRTITDIQGSVITLDSDLVIEGLEYQYTSGSVEYDGLGLGIRDLKEDQVTLRQQPPATWLGQTVTFGSGCDKSVETCRLWGNEAQFGGLGIAMVDYNPLYENTK